jgi:hypothetical protein
MIRAAGPEHRATRFWALGVDPQGIPALTHSGTLLPVLPCVFDGPQRLRI